MVTLRKKAAPRRAAIGTRENRRRNLFKGGHCEGVRNRAHRRTAAARRPWVAMRVAPCALRAPHFLLEHRARCSTAPGRSRASFSTKMAASAYG